MFKVVYPTLLRENNLNSRTTKHILNGKHGLSCMSRGAIFKGLIVAGFVGVKKMGYANPERDACAWSLELLAAGG